MVVGDDRGVALRVVANVNEGLGGAGRQLESVEEGGRTGSLLVDRDLLPRTSVGVADGVGTALGDAGQQRLRGKRPIDTGIGVQTVSRDTAHQEIRSPRSDIWF